MNTKITSPFSQQRVIGSCLNRTVTDSHTLFLQYSFWYYFPIHTQVCQVFLLRFSSYCSYFNGLEDLNACTTLEFCFIA
jgi:hypothetical protein